MEKYREVASTIIDEFEKILNKHKIKLLNEEREEKENEACIYGSDYYNLEDKIVEILDEHIT